MAPHHEGLDLLPPNQGHLLSSQLKKGGIYWVKSKVASKHSTGQPPATNDNPARMLMGTLQRSLVPSASVFYIQRYCGVSEKYGLGGTHN